jgi:hypothetical protein
LAVINFWSTTTISMSNFSCFLIPLKRKNNKNDSSSRFNR